jgi:hypothetical protein
VAARTPRPGKLALITSLLFPHTVTLRVAQLGIPNSIGVSNNQYVLNRGQIRLRFAVVPYQCLVYGDIINLFPLLDALAKNGAHGCAIKSTLGSG